MKALTLDCGYLGPSPWSSGCVGDFLPFLTIGIFAGGGGYVSAGWLFWYASIEWRPVNDYKEKPTR